MVSLDHGGWPGSIVVDLTQARWAEHVGARESRHGRRKGKHGWYRLGACSRCLNRESAAGLRSFRTLIVVGFLSTELCKSITIRSQDLHGERPAPGARHPKMLENPARPAKMWKTSPVGSDHRTTPTGQTLVIIGLPHFLCSKRQQ